MMIYGIEGGPGILCFKISAQPAKFYFKVDLIHYKCTLQMLEQPAKKKLREDIIICWKKRENGIIKYSKL